MPGSACVFSKLRALLSDLTGELRHRHNPWVSAARHIGLAVVRAEERGAARGVIEGYPIDIEWNGPALMLALRGPALAEPSRASAAHAQLLSQLTLARMRERREDPRLHGVVGSDELTRAALSGLEQLARTGDAVFILSLSAPSGEETSTLAGAVRIAAWVGEALGWQTEDPTLQIATGDPDPRVRLRAWERLLGGWAPTGLHSASNHALARQASRSDDPLIATLGALHLGEEGLPLLKATVLRPESTDEVAGRALRGVWDEMSASELCALLERSGEEVIVRTCRALGQKGAATSLPALKRWAGDRGIRGEAARSAIEAIVSRTDAAPGALSVAPAGGGLSVASTDGALSQSPPRGEPRRPRSR